MIRSIADIGVEGIVITVRADMRRRQRRRLQTARRPLPRDMPITDHNPGGSGPAVESATLYRLLVETVRDYAIFALDATGHIITWNAGAERFKGYAPHEIIGKHFSVFYPPDDIVRGKPAWELEVASREGRLEDEGWRIKKDGSRFWANVVITALRDETGTLIGFAKVTRDLTERVKAERQAIEDARLLAQAEAANRTKSEFLAALSHELRTPLNAIGGYADLLQMELAGPLTEQQRLYLTRVRESQQHLLRVINDLLNYSRIEAGTVTYEKASVPLESVLDTVTGMVTLQASSRGIALRRDADSDHAVAIGDRVKIEQIVLNLLSNALKYTPRGGRVTVASTVAGEKAILTVTDTGPGIPADKLEDIFEPFVQLGRSFSSGHEGAGLGLAISRDLARAMNGDLTAESTLGEGAVFTLTLPAK